MRFIIFLCNFYCVFGFNFFPKYAQVFSDNLPGSYFGYSVLLQAGVLNSPARVIIGSPRSNSTNAFLRGIPEPGAVYSCPLNEKTCKQFLLDLNGNKQLKTENNQAYESRKNHGWLGGAIDGPDVASGRLAACSPRWINQIHKDVYYLQNGLCYLLEDSTNLDKTAKILLPLLNQYNQGYARGNESVYYYALGEAGMSVHFAKNYSELLFGAPGVLQWRGTIGKYAPNGVKPFIPNPHHTPRLHDFGYFGYAMSSGKFNKSSSEIWYVGGAPRGRNLFGQVLIFEYGSKLEDAPKIYYEMSGQQEGEYFGAAITVGDLNGDGADDVIVGSPMYSTPNHYDIGCVYIYTNNLESKGNFKHTIIHPAMPANGIRFGTAVSVIGDVNKDGFSDLAVGAPYMNDGQGAIFIYLGSQTGISEQFSQKIMASDVAPNLKGFGASFSRGVDIDNNNYNDLAVGSFLSSHAVILKTRPVVTIQPVLSSPRSQISIDVKSFAIRACLKYTGSHLPPSLNVKFIIDADDFYKRVSFKDPRGSIIQIVREKSFKYNEDMCETVDVVVVNTQSDFTQPIMFKMTYELMEPPETDFCATCPIVDKRLTNYTILSIPYEIGCGTDNICRPDLKLKAGFKHNKPYLVLGEDEKVDVAVNITNLGEPGFACKFYAEIPSDSSFVKIPDICQNVKDNLLLCDMGNPLKQNEMKTLVLPLDIIMLGNNDRVVVKLNVSSAGAEVTPEDNSVTLEIPLKTVVGISVIGISNPEQFNFIEQEKLKQDNLTFNHEYTIQNLGPSPLDDLELIFLIPQSFDADDFNVVEVYKPEDQADGTSMICKSSSPGGFYVDDKDTSEIIEADGPTAAGRRSRARRTPAPSSSTEIPTPEENNVTGDAEELNLPMDNPSVFTRVQKLIASDKELPEGVTINRTLALGCGVDSGVECMEVRCTSGVLKKNSRAVVNFKLRANLTILDQKRGEKDTIVISSSVQPISKYFKVNKTYTHTLLQGNVRQGSPLKWIILGLILGIILLSITIYVLYRAGFFQRKQHEKLMNEKEDTFGDELTVQTD